MKHLLIGWAALASVAMAATRAMAVPTIAAWDHDFGLSTKDGVTLDLQGNTPNADGEIVLGSHGLLLTAPNNMFTGGYSNDAITVIMEVENISMPSAASVTNTLCAIELYGSVVGPSVDCLYDGKLWLGWTHAANGQQLYSQTVSSGAHRIALSYANKGSASKSGGERVTLDGEQIMSASLTASTTAISKLHLGEYLDGTCVAQGLKIKKIAVVSGVSGVLSAAEIAAYDWDNLRSHLERFKANFANRILTWKGRSEPATQISMGDVNSAYAGFDLESGAQGTLYPGDQTAIIPGYDEKEVAPWKGFSSAQEGYTAPGLVLRYPAYIAGANLKSRGVFVPMTLGGLIVEEGARGVYYSSAKYRTQYPSFEDKSSDSDGYRTTEFGDISGTVPTYFVFNDSLNFTRRGELTLWGDVNFEIATGKVFYATTANENMKITLKGGAKLKMAGEGTFQVRTLTATAEGGQPVALDFSAQSLTRTTPFIDGNLKIDATTRIAFPTNLPENTAFKVCSGTLTAPSAKYVVSGWVGSEAKILTIQASGNTLSYELTAAVVDGVAYASLQDAFDAAGVNAEVVVCKAGSVILSSDKTLSNLTTHADLTLAGSHTLTLRGYSDLQVDEGCTATFNLPIALYDTVTKTGEGLAAFNGGITNGVGTAAYAGAFTNQLAVAAGEVEVDSRVDCVIIAGCGVDADNWPLITLKANCVVADSATASPVISNVKSYGKLVQDGATVTHKTETFRIMDCYLGAGTYVLNSGTLDLGKQTMSLQRTGGIRGHMLFEQNGGTLTTGTDGITLMRNNIQNASISESYKFVLNGGTANTYINGGTLTNQPYFVEKVIAVMKGGTYNIRNETSLYNNLGANLTISNSVSIANNSGVVTTVPPELFGTGTITFLGAGTLDFSGCSTFAGGYTVSAGTLRLGADSLTADSDLTVASGAKLGLNYEGEQTVKSLTLGTRLCVAGEVYGASGYWGSRFFENLPGTIRPTTGTSKTGMVIFMK